MDSYEMFNKAEDLYAEEKFQEALIYFLQIKDPDLQNDCQNYIGCCYLNLGRFEEALDCLTKLANQETDWETPIINIGRVYLEMGNYKKAKKYFKHAKKIKPDSADVYYYLGVYHQKISDIHLSKAIQNYQISLEYDNTQPEAHMDLGICLKQAGYRTRAKEEFDAAVQLDSIYYKAIHNQGLMYDTERDYQNALECYLKVVQLHPTDSECYMRIVRCYYKLHDLANAEKWNNELLHLPNANPEDIEQAKRFCRMVLKKEPSE